VNRTRNGLTEVKLYWDEKVAGQCVTSMAYRVDNGNTTQPSKRLLFCLLPHNTDGVLVNHQVIRVDELGVNHKVVPAVGI
jgi:hypothetical protein